MCCECLIRWQALALLIRPWWKNRPDHFTNIFFWFGLFPIRLFSIWISKRNLKKVVRTFDEKPVVQNSGYVPSQIGRRKGEVNQRRGMNKRKLEGEEPEKTEKFVITKVWERHEWIYVTWKVLVLTYGYLHSVAQGENESSVNFRRKRRWMFEQMISLKSERGEEYVSEA